MKEKVLDNVGPFSLSWKRFQHISIPESIHRKFATACSMGVTIYDLAREAGVGIGTVSRCLNNHPSVAAHTRARVLAVAKRLSYQPHAYAQRLASRKTNTVCAIIPYFTNYFFIQVLQGVQDKAAELGFDLILYGVNNPADVEYYLRRSLHRGRVDGVLFFSMKLPDSYAQKFRQMGLPLVLVDGFHEYFDSIHVENKRGAQDATRYLISLGHRRIAMINGGLHTTPARDRFDGYVEALREAGIPLDEGIVVVSESQKQDGFSREAGHESMERLLPQFQGSDPVTAVFVASDVQAMGALECGREHGVRIPGDAALIGFDDIELAQHLQLTTMRQPMYEMGVLALERLVARMSSPDFPPAHSTFVPQLVVRETSGPPLQSGQNVARDVGTLSSVPSR